MLKKDIQVLKSLIASFQSKDNLYQLRYFGDKLYTKSEFFEFEATIPKEIYGDFLTALVNTGKSLENGNDFSIRIEEFKNSLDEPSQELISASFLKHSFQTKKLKLVGISDEYKPVIQVLNFNLNSCNPFDMLYITPDILTSSNPKVLEVNEAVITVYDIDDSYFNITIPTILSKLLSKDSIINSMIISKSSLENDLYTVSVNVTNSNRITYTYIYRLKGNRDLTILK